MAPLLPADYAEKFAGDLPAEAQSAMIDLIEALVGTGDARSDQAQAALDRFLDAAGQGVLKDEPARGYIQPFIETPNVIAARYFYKDSSKVLDPQTRAALIALIVDRFFQEVWTCGLDA